MGQRNGKRWFSPVPSRLGGAKGLELETTSVTARTEPAGRLQELESPAWWSMQEEASVSGLPAAGSHMSAVPLVARSLPSLPQD